PPCLHHDSILQTIKVAYCTTLGFVQKMKATKNMLIDSNNQRTKLLCFKVRKQETTDLPSVINTPEKKIK
ncbi:29125_t:CDS:1, partial [Gigaspora margarita]